MVHRALSLALLLLIAIPIKPATAQRSEPSVIAALEISETIRIDGRLEEGVWSQARHASNFTQRELDYGAPVSERTEVAILFDRSSLYIGFWGFDREPEKILANYLGKRTFWGTSLSWKVNKYLTLGGDYERNKIRFSGEEFTVDEAGGRIDFAFSPVLFGAVAGQWNNEDEEVILNFRINWIPKPGTDLFLVINHMAETEESSWIPLQTTAVSKLVWRFEF